jgi:hypothetical protein
VRREPRIRVTCTTSGTRTMARRHEAAALACDTMPPARAAATSGSGRAGRTCTPRRGRSSRPVHTASVSRRRVVCWRMTWVCARPPRRRTTSTGSCGTNRRWLLRAPRRAPHRRHCGRGDDEGACGRAVGQSFGRQLARTRARQEPRTANWRRKDRRPAKGAVSGRCSSGPRASSGCRAGGSP